MLKNRRKCEKSPNSAKIPRGGTWKWFHSISLAENYMIATKIFVLSAIRNKLGEPPKNCVTLTLKMANFRCGASMKLLHKLACTVSCHNPRFQNFVQPFLASTENITKHYQKREKAGKTPYPSPYCPNRPTAR